MPPLRITVNGTSMDVPGPATVETVLTAHGLKGSPCAVEVNERLVPKRDHADHTLSDGDRVEIVTLVGGG